MTVIAAREEILRAIDRTDELWILQAIMRLLKLDESAGEWDSDVPNDHKIVLEERMSAYNRGEESLRGIAEAKSVLAFAGK